MSDKKINPCKKCHSTQIRFSTEAYRCECGKYVEVCRLTCACGNVYVGNSLAKVEATWNAANPVEEPTMTDDSAKHTLLAMKFTGGRYTDGSIDTDAMKSIIACEDAVRGIALDLYMKDHPDANEDEIREQIKEAAKFKITSVEDKKHER